MVGLIFNWQPCMGPWKIQRNELTTNNTNPCMWRFEYLSKLFLCVENSPTKIIDCSVKRNCWFSYELQSSNFWQKLLFFCSFWVLLLAEECNEWNGFSIFVVELCCCGNVLFLAIIAKTDDIAKLLRSLQLHSSSGCQYACKVEFLFHIFWNMLRLS